MPRFSALNDIARVLQAQIVNTLSSAPDIDFPVTSETVPLAPPSDDLASEVVAILYLYHIEIDPHQRNRKLIPDASDPSLMIKPPLPLQLRFLFVPLAPDDETNQLMLGRVLQHFHDHPNFQPMPGTSLGSSRGEGASQLRVRFDLTTYQDLSQLWSSLSRPFRLSAGLLVDVVSIDSGLAAENIPRTGSIVGLTRDKSQGTGT